MGFKSREMWHHTDWEAVKKNPAILSKIVGRWVMVHDPEQYAYDNYEAAARHVIEGTPFPNSNSVPGYTYKPWDIKDLLEASASGISLADDGDWT